MAKVFIPALLHQFTNNVSQIDVEGPNVRTIVNNLDLKFPGIKSKLVEGHKIKSSISVAVDGNITPMGLLEDVEPGSEVHFLPAISGG
jgi:molybdopterin converting factor small subunit|tara:strand:+ start:1896 stop:2159 length:264 start_codon:yes stop_codon:yes gene_type:complete